MKHFLALWVMLVVSFVATDDVAAMRFVRHANGLCFGVVRFQTYAGYGVIETPYGSVVHSSIGGHGHSKACCS